MAITLNIKTNSFLREVFEEGHQEGQLEGKRVVIRRQLTSRFGVLPAWAEQQIAAADAVTLERWGVQLLTTASLEDVFRLPEAPDSMS